MTDKQIIIDVCPYQGECSVSGCKRNDDGCFVRQLFEERNRAENSIVELNKTIKAKEQECEELKIYIESNEQQVKYVETLVMDNDRLINELDQLKAENDELKGVVDENFLHALEEQDRADKLSKTLTEIKEIIHFNKTNRLSGGADISIEQILQKISEVEDGV